MKACVQSKSASAESAHRKEKATTADDDDDDNGCRRRQRTTTTDDDDNDDDGRPPRQINGTQMTISFLVGVCAAVRRIIAKRLAGD